MSKKEVDFILFNAKIYTVDDSFSVAEAFAVKDGKFVAVGSNRSVLSKYEAKQQYDAALKAVYPGFNDGHCHFSGYGENRLRYVELYGSRSFDEVLERLEIHQRTNSSDWILGRGWDQNLWETKEFPDNKQFDSLFPNKKVFLIRIDGHAALVSNATLDEVGISGKTEIEGGDILLDAFGNPTGILIDNAYDKVKESIPEMTDNEQIKALQLAQESCFKVGLTTVTDAGLSLKRIQLIDSAQQAGILKMRINAMINPDDETTTHFFTLGPIEKQRLTVRTLKLYADGALGSRGAKLIEPYSDDETTTGLMLFDKTFYNDLCKRAYDANYQVAMHAIGDAANRFTLNLYASFLKEKNDRRWRIEHAQIINPDDFSLFGMYSIIPSIQSTHATSDMTWAADRLGAERLKTAYAQRLLLEQNGWLINGTDFPIEDINPLFTFYAAVERKNQDDVIEGFQTENALTRKEALRSITVWPAKGSFEENRKGTIEVGKDADFVVLTHDIMTVEASKIKQTEVMSLYILGEKVYQQNQ
ncbi:MAG: amidohydrolase [Lentimicrobiaceae bacterium]|jgi:predicted amidohydrolase YtcJ|nr:amidohydrolase [Lentimicrobiaceae bacterium]